MKKLWGHIIYYREEAMQKTLHKRITVKKKTFYILCLVFSYSFPGFPSPTTNFIIFPPYDILYILHF